jgi:nitrogen fixation/metabolism regulation signal transduction histidine kinase
VARIAIRVQREPFGRELAVAFNVMLDSLERNRRSLEEAKEQMRRQKTLAEMGRFSLMIAHELKNPLSIIKCSLDVLKKDFALSSDNTMVFYIEDEIMRLNRLIGDFLIFAAGRAFFSRPDLNAPRGVMRLNCKNRRQDWAYTTDPVMPTWTPICLSAQSAMS